MLKETLYQHCLDYLDQRLKVCLDRIASVEDDLSSETKSSAGDKHETGRAMLQLEREKLGFQLATIEKEKEELQKIPLSGSSEKVRLGSVVKTSYKHYFIAISAGILKVKNETYIAISPQSPIGQLILGKQVGDAVSFRGNSFEIVEII